MPHNAVKPRQLRAQHNRRKILDAALEMIAEEGIAAVSLRKVAARSHFSPAALYEYFDNKDALINTLCQEVDTLLANYLKQAIPNSDAVTHLVEIGLRYIAFATENPREYQLMQLRNPAAPTEQADIQEGAFGILLVAVKRLGDDTTPLDAQAFAYACWSFVHGLASLENQLKSAFTLDFAATQRAALERFISN